jgi:phenylacetate-CoA ligase
MIDDFRRYDGLETLGPGAVRELQEEFLKRHLGYLADNSSFYRGLFRREGIRVENLGLGDLGGLPLTGKSDLGGHNDEFLAVPLREIEDIVLSSGTTGRPTRVMYSRGDLARLAYNEKVAFSRIGVSADDVVLLTCTMDRCFIAGLAYYSGVRALGAAAVRNGLNTFESHMGIIKDMRPTVIVGVPSFLHKLGLFMREHGLEPSDTSVVKLVCIGEPLRDRALLLLKRGEELEELWGGRVFSTYASSETITTFCECSMQRGGHLHPALAVVEIVDGRGNVLPPGEAGEVVVTPLMVEGMPLLRFRTGDISFLMDEPCPCGRTSPRLGPVLGRKEQMIKLHGTTIYPQTIYSVLDEAQEISEYYVVASSDYELSDNLRVFVSVREGSCSAEDIAGRLQARLRVRPEVVLAGEDEVRRTVYTDNSRKPVRFMDRRQRTDGM